MKRRRCLSLGLSVPFLGSFTSCGQDRSPAPALTRTRDRLTLIDLPKAYEVTSGTSLEKQLNAELRALVPKAPQGTDKELFSDYQNTAATWSNNWTKPLDFTGVAWNKPQAGTLITDRHVIMAKHYQHGVGATLVFHDAKGTPVTRSILARHVDPATDMAIGQLNAPVPDSIAVYPLLKPDPKTYDTLVRTWIVMTDNERKVLFFPVRAVAFAAEPDKAELFMTALDTANRLDKVFEETLISGDSGHPAFLLSKGQLILMSVNTRGGNGMTGPYLGGSVNQTWIQKAIQA